MFRQRKYKGHGLIALREGALWRVSMDDGYRTGLHPSPERAFEEAERWIDAKRP
jgi:hypothetical protein